MLSKKDILSHNPGRYKATAEALRLADVIMDKLWAERSQERGFRPHDRSGSCKFAALLVRDLFGGKLAGNLDHVFVMLDGVRIDINQHMEDAMSLGARAYRNESFVFLDPEFRESLASCLPRVRRWTDEFDMMALSMGLECHEIKYSPSPKQRLNVTSRSEPCFQ